MDSTNPQPLSDAVSLVESSASFFHGRTVAQRCRPVVFSTVHTQRRRGNGSALPTQKENVEWAALWPIADRTRPAAILIHTRRRATSDVYANPVPHNDLRNANFKAICAELVHRNGKVSTGGCESALPGGSLLDSKPAQRVVADKTVAHGFPACPAASPLSFYLRHRDDNVAASISFVCTQIRCKRWDCQCPSLMTGCQPRRGYPGSSRCFSTRVGRLSRPAPGESTSPLQELFGSLAVERGTWNTAPLVLHSRGPARPTAHARVGYWARWRQERTGGASLLRRGFDSRTPYYLCPSGRCPAPAAGWAVYFLPVGLAARPRRGYVRRRSGKGRRLWDSVEVGDCPAGLSWARRTFTWAGRYPGLAFARFGNPVASRTAAPPFSQQRRAGDPSPAPPVALQGE